MTTNWRIAAVVFAVVAFALALTDPSSTWVAGVGYVPPIVSALGWGLAGFGWAFLVNRVAAAFCWLNTGGSCRVPRR